MAKYFSCCLSLLSVILIFFLTCNLSHAQEASQSTLEVQLKDVQIVIPGQPPVRFESRLLNDNEIKAGQVVVTGILLVTKGELLSFDLVLNGQVIPNSTPLRKGGTSFTPGSYNFGVMVPVNAIYNLKYRPVEISFRAVGFDQVRRSPGNILTIPVNPVILKYEPTRLSVFKIIPVRRQISLRVGLEPPVAVDFSKIPKEGLVHKVSREVNAGLNFAWQLQGGKVTRVFYELGGRYGTQQKAVGNIAQNQANDWLLLRAGDTLDIRFHVKGVDVDQNGNVMSVEKEFIDDQHAKVIVQRKEVTGPITPFNVTFSNQRVQINNEVKKFSDIPATGWIYYADKPVKITVFANWKMQGANIFSWISKNGGKTPEALDHPMVDGGQYSFSASPGDPPYKIVWGANGVDVDSLGGNAGAIKSKSDTAQAVIYVVKPNNNMPLVAMLSNIKLNNDKGIEQVDGVDQPGGYGTSIDALISGGLKSEFAIDRIEISLNGGGTWNRIEAKPAWSYAFKATHDATYNIRFRIIAKDGRMVDPEKLPKGRLRFVKRPLHVEIQAYLGQTSLYNFPSGDLLLSAYNQLPGYNRKVPLTGRIVGDGSLNHVDVTLDGGQRWEKLTYDKIGNFSYLFEPKENQNYDLRFRYFDNDGRTVEPDKLPHVRFRFVQKARVELSNIKLATIKRALALEKIGSTVMLPQAEMGLPILITAELKSNVPLSSLQIKFDKTANWEVTATTSPQWAYSWAKPVANRDYELSFKAVGTKGELYEVVYPKKIFRFVSEDMALVAVPMVVNSPSAEAKRFIESAGLIVTLKQEETADSAAYQGMTIRTNPPAGTKVKKGSLVEIVYAKILLVPWLVGGDERTAISLLQSAGYKASVKYALVKEAGKIGIVISQKPDKGSRLKKGSRVELTVGKAN